MTTGHWVGGQVGVCAEVGKGTVQGECGESKERWKGGTARGGGLGKRVEDES